jgi:hypothetical protein
MNQIKNPREGIVQKYFNFLVELKARIQKDPTYPVADIITKHKVTFSMIARLKELKIISGTGPRGRQWIGRYPDYDMIQEIRLQIRKVKDSKLKPFEKFKPSDLINPVSGKQMGVGNVHYLKSKPILKSWSLIKSLTIFKYKLRIYKLK